MERILVTGGAGFIGSHLCEQLLSEGAEVISLDNFNDFYDPEVKRENIATLEKHPRKDRFKSYAGDIRNQKELLGLLEREKPTGVVHLAAMAGVRPSLKNPELYIDVNIRGTQLLLDACIKKGIRNFIFASSSSVYGKYTKVPFAETDATDFPISPYAATKKAGEVICHAYAHLYPVKITCLRFFTAYGPRQRPDLAIHKFAKLMLEGAEIPFFGDGETARDYTYIEDLVAGISRALAENGKRESRYEIFNLGESRSISLAEMIACLEKRLGVKGKLKKLPLEEGDMVVTCADISKARKMLGYAPETSFEEGIAKFAEWIRRKELVSFK